MMKKGLKIHLGICLLFAIIWIVCAILGSRHVLIFDNFLFSFIAFLLLISYLLHHAYIHRS